MRRSRIFGAGVALLLLGAVVVVVWGMGAGQRGAREVSAQVVSYGPAPSAEGFARALAVRDFDFPADHGPHPEYQTEWWYYTGNLESSDGRHFGFQFTIFRRALTPEPPERGSAWGASQAYMAHFALTDVAGQRFYAAERLSRGAAGLAGAQAEPFRVWLEGWEASGSGEAPRLRAALTEAEGGPVALDIQLTAQKPPALQGDRGLSAKSDETGNASYYYSLTRLAAKGTITLGGDRFEVGGMGWMDHEFSTSYLGPDAVGWDWFALQLSDGREIMFFQIRRDDGTVEPATSGTLVETDGTTRYLARDEVRLEVLATWQSPHTAATYPARWRLSIPSAALTLDIEPWAADQELQVGSPYWEGAVRIRGADGLTGNGYIEMTGYTGSIGGQF